MCSTTHLVRGREFEIIKNRQKGERDDDCGGDETEGKKPKLETGNVNLGRVAQNQNRGQMRRQHR